MVSYLLKYCHEEGFVVTLGEAWRSPDEAARLARAGKGIVKSKHCCRLAIDICLFRHGLYLEESKDYEKAGIYWETLGGTWGGRWSDGNHFELGA